MENHKIFWDFLIFPVKNMLIHMRFTEIIFTQLVAQGKSCMLGALIFIYLLVG